jgi:hypothetical protein
LTSYLHDRVETPPEFAGLAEPPTYRRISRLLAKSAPPLV